MSSSTGQPMAAPARDADAGGAWRELHARASAPYRAAGRFAWHFARGKLGHDPVFRGLLQQGLLRGARVVDIGCGRGLLASLLQACSDSAAAGAWPAAWSEAPAATGYTGIDLMQRDLHCAGQALAGTALAPRFVCADMRDAPLPACDLAVLLDVLHYVDHAAQLALLQRARDALLPQGRLLLRVGNAAERGGFGISHWVDTAVTLLRGREAPPRSGRSVDAWTALLHGLGFSVRSMPMRAGTPFANVLLVADLR